MARGVGLVRDRPHRRPRLQIGSAAVASVLTDGTLRHFDPMATFLAPGVPLAALAANAVIEESAGWRGVALPILLERLGGLPASVLDRRKHSSSYGNLAYGTWDYDWKAA